MDALVDSDGVIAMEEIDWSDEFSVGDALLDKQCQC